MDACVLSGAEPGPEDFFFQTRFSNLTRSGVFLLYLSHCSEVHKDSICRISMSRMRSIFQTVDCSLPRAPMGP